MDLEKEEHASTPDQVGGKRPYPSTGKPEDRPPDSEWDAGDMGCGELVMELRIRLRPQPPGHVLKLTARDPGALEDLPAWCRLTGHRLMYADHPIYLIQRKED